MALSLKNLLSPFLFNFAIEPLTEAIQASEEITSIDIGITKNKFSLYANDIILYLTNPERSVLAVLDLITKCGTVSGYKINLTISNVLVMNPPISDKLKTSRPSPGSKWL